MKRILLCFAILFATDMVIAQQKHALMIGIGDYDTKNTNWAKLNSIKDIEVMQAVLVRQNFDPNNISILVDKQATKQNIVAAMRKLIQDVGQDSDVVYIHISSHGAQLEDDNGDETDGLDEAIVTINAKWTEDKTEFSKVAGEYLRDDEFGALIEQLRARLGKNGDVVVCMDLCHSGTATRGEPVARGNKSPIVSDKYGTEGNSNKDNLKEFRENSLASRGDNNNLATYVVISAARAEEAAYETFNDENQKMGALSYAISKSLENLKDSTTYRSLFANIESIMDIKSNIQHPVLEGNGVDRGFLGGQFLVQEPYVAVESMDGDAKTMKIKSGTFSGVDAGAMISFYPSGTLDPAKAALLTKGKVISATEFSAEVQVEKNTGLQPKDIWAFVTGPVFRIKPISLKIEDKKKTGSFSIQEASAIRQKLKPLKQIVFNNQAPDLVLVKGNGHDSIFIANNGFLFATTEKKSLDENLKTYSKYKFLKELDVKDNSIDVEVKLGKLVNGKIEFAKPMGTVKGYEYHVGEVMVIAVHNKGAEDIYINILDFQPDGVVNPIFPNKAMKKPIQPFELKIAAGKEIIFKDYQIKIGPPLGSEVLKIFISNQEIDMEGVAREFKARNFMSVLETLVADAPQMVSRGGDVLNLTEAKGVVFNIPFQIKAKK